MVRTACILGLAMACLVAPALAQTPAEINNACIDDNPVGLAAASRALREDAAADFADLARRFPRAVELAALIAVRNGRLAEAEAEYRAILARLPGEGGDRFAEAARKLAIHQRLAVSGASRAAATGYALTSWGDEVRVRQGTVYSVATWTEFACGFESTPVASRAELFLRDAGGGLALTAVIGGTGLSLADSHGAALIALSDFNGGNCWGCARLRLFTPAADGTVAEISLPADSSVVPVSLRDLDSDGVPEVLGVDPRWEFWRSLCHACSPGVVAIYRLGNGQLAEACREFPAFYEEEISRHRANLFEGGEIQTAAGAPISLFLALVQAGRSEEAVAALTGRLDPARFESRDDRTWAQEARDDLLAALEAARKGPSRACPVNAMAIDR